MITLEEAKTIAEKAMKKTVDSCSEYKDAYMFESDYSAESDGGMDTAVVVMKDSGDVLGVTRYVLKNYTDLQEDCINKYRFD